MKVVIIACILINILYFIRQINIVKDCGSKFETIAIYGSYDKELVYSLSEIDNKSVILMNGIKIKNKFTPYRKIDLMIIIVDKLIFPSLVQTGQHPLIEINTIFIFDKNVRGYLIDRKFDFLHRRFDTSQIYYCKEFKFFQENVIFITTSNPYTNYAPASMWSFSGKLKFPDNRTDWTLYLASYPFMPNNNSKFFFIIIIT